MNNLLSYCGLVDATIRASDKDLPVQQKMEKKSSPPKQKLKSIQYLLPTEDSSELEVECSQSNLVEDEFHTILYSETDMSDSMILKPLHLTKKMKKS